MMSLREAIGGNGGSPVADPEVVARLHRVVGEALTELNASRETEGRPRLSNDDERALSRKLLGDEFRKMAEAAFAAGDEPLTSVTEQAVAVAVLDRLHGMAGLQPLLDDPEIRDIHISGHKTVWVTYRDGRKVRGPAVASSDDELIELVSTWARRHGRSERRWDYAHPALDLQLPNGDRLHALMAVSGRPAVTIRRHDFTIHRLDQLIELDACDESLGTFLSAAVRAKCNIIVAGGIGTGKTTALRCLINEIPAEERIITVEDSLEIGINHFEHLHPDYEMLEAREPNTEGLGEFTVAELVRQALRMDPKRVIVGEVRGGEVLPMLLAMSQGNEGSMCSVHADSSRSVFGRLAIYAAMTRERLEPEVTNLITASAVDLVVHLQWVGDVRQISSVREVVDSIEGGQIVTNELWRPGSDGRGRPASPPTQELGERLAKHGFDFTAIASAEGWWR